MSATDLTSTRESKASSEAVSDETASHAPLSCESTLSDACTDDLLLVVEGLYDQGRYSDALSAGASLGDLQLWQSAKGRVIAGRLALSLGAPRLCRVLHRLAVREYPSDARAIYYSAIAYWNRFGALHAWRRYRHVDLPVTADDNARADWLAMKAQLLGSLRDFSRAEEFMIEALELVPESAWLHVELSELFDKQDMPEESLKAAEEALSLQPYFRPAVQVAAHRLVHFGRDSQALSLLADAAERLQSGEVWCQLAALHRELEQYDKASQALSHAERLWPMARFDGQFTKWFAAQRCDIASLQGRYGEALELAKTIDQPFYQNMLPRLERAFQQDGNKHCSERECATRVRLPVPFVRQSFSTCAPATLAALSTFWSRPVSQQEIADRICYGGTHPSDERSWAEASGLVVREFSIREQTVEPLIRAGIPVAMTTIEPGMAHMQAIVGIDTIRGTYLLQDPSVRHVFERSSDELHRRYASSGPKGMVLLPPGEVQRLKLDETTNIELEDAPLYDLRYKLDAALAVHDRNLAESAFEQLQATGPGHRLTWQCRLTLAIYDGNVPEQLQCVDQLIAQFPDDANLVLMKWSLLMEFGNRDQRIELLYAAASRSNDRSIFLSHLALDLFEDARDHAEAVRCLKQALRSNPRDSFALSQLAEHLERQGQWSEALECYRLAACFNDVDEQQALRYFVSAQHSDQAETVLEWLRDRCQRFGHTSSQPYRTLAFALSQMDRSHEALELLQQAILRHPQDGDLLAYTAVASARANQPELCTQYMQAASGRCSPATLARTQAILSEFQSDRYVTRARFLDALEHDPLNYKFLQRVLELDSELEGPQQAQTRLHAYLQLYPHSETIRALWVQWSAEHGTALADDPVQDSSALITSGAPNVSIAVDEEEPELSPTAWIERLRELPDGDDAWVDAACTCLSARHLSLRDHLANSELLDSLMAEFAQRLRTNTNSWSAVATALNTLGRFRECVRWTQDWQSRTDARPGDLLAPIIARWEIYQLREARPIIARALALPMDTQSHCVRLLAGVDGMVTGDVASARNHAQSVEASELSDWYCTVHHHLTSVLSSWPEAGTIHDSTAHNQARERVRTLLTDSNSVDTKRVNHPLTRWIMLRSVANVARSYGLVFTSFWLRLKATAIRWGRTDSVLLSRSS